MQSLLRVIPIALTMFFASCSTIVPSDQIVAGVAISDVERIVDGNLNTIGVQCLAENKTGKRLNVCVIKFEALDDRGVRIAEGQSVTSALAPGKRWECKVMFVEIMMDVANSSALFNMGNNVEEIRLVSIGHK